MKLLMIVVFSLFVIFAPLLTFGVDKVSKSSSGVKMNQSEQTADSALDRADELFQARDYAKALEEYKACATIARDEFNRSVEVEALSQIARMNLLLGHKEEGRKSLEQAGQRADDADPAGWSRYLGVRGRFEWKYNDLETARKTFEAMYNYCQANGLYSRAIDAAHMIAIVSESFEDQIESMANLRPYSDEIAAAQAVN